MSTISAHLFCVSVGGESVGIVESSQAVSDLQYLVEKEKRAMALALFIPIMLIILIAVYVGCFKNEFDAENLNSVWIIVGIFIVLLLVWAILASFGAGMTTY